MFWTVLLIVFSVYLAWKLLFNEEENPLDKLPGPYKYPLIGNVPQFFKINAVELFLKLREFQLEYGDRFVIKIFKRRVIHISNPNDLEVILSHPRNIKKSKPYTFLHEWLGTGLLLSTGNKWHNRRKILTPTFHFNILKNFTYVMKENSRRFVDQLRGKEDGEVELLSTVSDFTLCTICETAMGTQLDSARTTATAEYKSNIFEIGCLLLNRLSRVWLHNNLIYKLTPMHEKFHSCIKKVHAFADNVIMERKKSMSQGDRDDVAMALEGADVGEKKRLAMLDLLLEAEDKGEIDLEGIKEEVNTFMFEGHDTTAMAITYGLMLLADHEDVQTRIYEECQSIFGDSDRTPSTADLANMKYLEAVIKETLRLYPSVPFVAREVTEDFMLGDVLVKKGSEIGIHIYDLHRRADLYPEPDQFRPERFLGGGHRHPFAFVPFSAGPRNCIGQRFAMLEMKCLLSEVCRNFILAPIEKGARPVLIADILLRSIKPIYVRFIKRK